MFRLRLIYSQLYGLLRKNRIEQEMDDEMRFHLLMRTRENIERGMRPDEAEREARRRFGNVGRIKDMARDIKGGGFMETLLQDLRYGARMAERRRRPRKKNLFVEFDRLDSPLRGGHKLGS